MCKHYVLRKDTKRHTIRELFYIPKTIIKSLENDVSFTACALTIKTTLQTKTKLNCLKFVSKSWCLTPVRERIICFTSCHIRYLGRNFICWTFCHICYLGRNFICWTFCHLHYLVRIFICHVFFHLKIQLFLWGVTFCHLHNRGGDIIYDIFIGAFSLLHIWCGIISYKKSNLKMSRGLSTDNCNAEIILGLKSGV